MGGFMSSVFEKIRLSLIVLALVGFSFGSLVMFLTPAKAITNNSYCASYPNDPNCVKARNIQNQINQQNQQKAQQQAVADKLKSEVGKINNDIQTTQNSIDKLNGQIADLTRNINNLTDQINQQTTQIEAEKAKLESTINNMYVDSETNNGLVGIVGAGNLSDLVATQQSYTAVENEIDATAKHIQDLKAQTEITKSDVEKKKDSVKGMHDQQVQQKSTLNNQLSLKNKLISDTNTSISQIDATVNQYQGQLRSVDGDISNFLASLNARGTHAPASGDLVVRNDAPWLMSQDDPRWGGQQIYYSDRDSFARYGCALTSLAMVATKYGMNITPPGMRDILQRGSGMYADGVAWGGVPDSLGNGFSLPPGVGYTEAVNWGVIDSYVNAKRPVIVHLNAFGSSGHWVVIDSKIGDKYSVQDPAVHQVNYDYDFHIVDRMFRLVR